MAVTRTACFLLILMLLAFWIGIEAFKRKDSARLWPANDNKTGGAEEGEALSRGLKVAEAHRFRGEVHRVKMEYDKALADLTEATTLNPNDPSALNNLAWLLATCPKGEVRDGRKAVEHATRACELTGWREPHPLDTLAAAHAECGDFEEAAKWEIKAVILGASDNAFQQQARRRLKLYQSGKPYREE
jgi:tetratricopeptide (TPR) repeat protein